MQSNCNKLSKELSDENDFFLEICSVDSLSTSDNADANYKNEVDPHDIIMNIPVPKCSVGANMPCSIMMSEIIFTATSKQILRVFFDLG